MQRSEYILLSTALRAALTQIERSTVGGTEYRLGLRVGIEHAAIHVAEALSLRTQAFDSARFLNDCGIPPLAPK